MNNKKGKVEDWGPWSKTTLLFEWDKVSFEGGFEIFGLFDPPIG